MNYPMKHPARNLTRTIHPVSRNLHSMSSVSGNPHLPFYYYDLKILFPTLFLIGIGIVMVYSASSALAMEKFSTEYYFLKKQAAFALIGIMLLVVCRHCPLKLIHSMAYPVLMLSFCFLAAIPITHYGFSAGGATRWLRIGGLSFQPAEFTKVAMILFMAYSLDKKFDRLDDFYIGFLPHVLVLGVLTMLIMLQPDFGSVVILCAITWIMMFIAGVRIKHLTLSLLSLVPLAAALIWTADYRVERLASFMDPWKYASDGGYQIIHSLMAFGTGGLWGAGIGDGYQKLFYLPEPHTDFIFSVIGEELGLAGVLFIIALYGIIIGRGIRISLKAGNTFTCFLAAGITLSLGLQVCVNIGVALALLPTKGLTLPFLSYGGTSLILNMACIGILMNIRANQPT